MTARKFGLHLILAHQHLSQLREAGEKVYSSVMTSAQTKVVFGGLSPEDAPIVAELLFMGELDLEEPKSTLDKPTVTNYVRTWLQNKAQGTSTTSSVSSGWGASTTEGETLRLDEDDVEQLDARSTSGSESGTFGKSYALAASSSHGWSAALTPVLTILPTQVFSLQEQVYKATATVVNQPPQHAIVKISGEPSVQVKTPFVAEAIARDERVEGFKTRAFQLSPFALPRGQAEKLLESRRKDLRLQAKRHTTPEEPDNFLE